MIGTLNWISNVLLQTVSQLTVTLHDVLRSVTVVLTQLPNTISNLYSELGKVAGQLTGILATNTDNLSTISTIVIQAGAKVTAATLTTNNVIAINGASTQAFGAIFGTVTRISQVLGPITNQVQSSLAVVVQTANQIVEVGFNLYFQPTEAGTNTFTAVITKAFAAAFEFVKSIQAVITSVIKTIATATTDVVEAVNALAVVLASVLHAVLAALAKAAEVLQGLSQIALQVLNITTAALGSAVNSINTIVSQITSSITSKSGVVHGLTVNVTFIKNSLSSVIAPFTDSFTAIAKLVANLDISFFQYNSLIQ